MITAVDLHLRSNPAGDHRALGMVSIEADGAQLAPHQEIALRIDGRRVRAQITSLHQRGSHLPRVYADEMHAEALA
jgi:hypothetical protein